MPHEMRSSAMSRPEHAVEAEPAEPAAPASQLALAVLDLVEGARSVRLWGRLGWMDIRGRYRRTTLGPLWITMSMGALTGVMGGLYSVLFGVEVESYVPRLALGFVVWGMISAQIKEGCLAFVDSGDLITQIRLPLSIHVFRMVWRNVIVFFHNAVIVVIVAILFAVWPGWAGLLAIPGLALLCLNGIWAGLLLGAFSARYRDVSPIIESVMRIVFFATPVIWTPELLPEKAVLPLTLNPFYHALELVRTPLLGEVPDPASWIAMIGVTVAAGLATFVAYARCRRRIPYWI